MERLRVLLAIGSLGGGGSERQLVGLLQRLDRRRFAPHLFLLRREGPLLNELPDDVPVAAFSDGRRAPRINWPGRIHRQQVAALRKQIAQWSIDCVYDRNFHTTLVTAPACGRVPRISTAVSDPERDLIAQETRFVALKRRRLRHAYQTASKVVAVSEGVRQALLRDHQLQAEQVVTIHSPVDLDRIDRFQAEPPAIELAPNRFHVVMAGRLLEAKGCLDLVEATAICLDQGHRQLQVHLLGEGPLRGALESRIASAGLEDHVRLHGFQQNPYAIFRGANLVCHPSHYEGLPNVLLEAMACQTPVLAADCPSGPREILKDEELGALVPPGDPSALANAMCDIMQNEQPARDKLPAARRRVEQDFGPQQAVRRLEELIVEVAASCPSS